MPIIFAAFEVAGAELAATLAAEATAAAAAEAATVAAAEAAATTAAEQAAAQAATQAAAQQTAQAGIMEIGGTTAANTGAPLTAEAVQNAAMQAGQNVAPEVANAGVQGISPAQQAYMEASTAANNTGIAQGVKPLPAYNNAFPTFEGTVTSPVSGFQPSPAFEGVTSGSQGASSGFFNPTQAPGQGPLQYQLSAPNTSQGLKLGSSLESGIQAPSNALYTPYQPSALENGFNTAVKFAKENPFTAMTGAYMGANALGLLNPSGSTFNEKGYDGPLNKYRLSPDFKPGNANPEDFQYTPRRYAGGGVMGVDPNTISVGYEQGGQMPETQNYARGGNLSESIENYQKMLNGKPQAAPARSADVGIYYDQDPDTRYQDPFTAAQIRQAKVNQRAYVSPPAAKRPTPMGQLQMASVKPRKQGGDDVEAARGGIMQSYADGGVTGEGNLNLQIPLNLGSGGGGGGGAAGGGFGGYTPVGGGNVNPNTGGGGFGGLGGGGKPPGGIGGMLQGIAGLLGNNGYDARAVAANPQGFMDDMRQMDMFSHGPNPFMGGGSSRLSQPGQDDNMIAPAVMNYQDVIGGRGNMLRGGSQPTMGGGMMYKDAQYRPERDARPFHDIQTAPSYGNTFAQGGITSLGGYASGGNPRLLRGPGDGMSDNIPATINGRQPARLADGEFVIPADVVSHLGNGSTEAGAKQLHAMMDKVRSARTGNKKQGKQIVAEKYLPKKKNT